MDKLEVVLIQVVEVAVLEVTHQELTLAHLKQVR